MARRNDKAKSTINFGTCDKCGQSFDPSKDELIECPTCGVRCSTACCIAGRGVECFECENSPIDSDVSD